MNIVCSDSKGFVIMKYREIIREPITSVVVKHNDAAIEVIGKWDTGANISSISVSTAKALALQPDGYSLIATAGGANKRPSYYVDLDLGNGVLVQQLRVCEGDFDNQGIGILIGMDIISQGDFHLLTATGQTYLYFKVNSTPK